MSAAEAAPVASPKSAAPKKAASPKKRAAGAKAKVAASHPTYQAMIKSAITHLKETKGSSRAAILKYILQNYKVGDNVKLVNARIRSALKRGVTVGALKQVKGTGASGSFRLGDKAKKTGAAKPKKAKKAAKPKKAKKAASPKKAKKPKSPKKKASPKKPKTPKKKASPKKPKAAKKSPAKKAAKPKKASPKKASPKKAVQA